ncbi:peptidylprolyl isomerase [Myxococcaceae bacterium GXIMD 01537]
MLSLGGLLLSACGDSNVVAEVGKTPVTRADVTAFVQGQSRRDRIAPAGALDVLVTRSLLAEEARRSGIADEPEVQARLSAVRRELLAQALLERRLADATREDALRKRYDEDKASLARKQAHVRHILVRLPTDAPGQARARSRINELYARLQGGADFAQVARESSDDTVTAANGGDLGWVRDGQVDPAFFTEAAAIKAGETSKPFATVYGLHLVQAVEGVQVVTPTFDEVRGKLAAEARGEAEQQLLTELRERIPVKRHPERLPAAPPAGAVSGADAGDGK